MKKLLLTFILAGAISSSFSQDQLSQSGFNVWTTKNIASTPSQWQGGYTLGIPPNLIPAPISSSTDASHLTKSLKLETIDLNGNPNFGFVVLGNVNGAGPSGGTPFTLAADSLIFDAKCNIVADDSANVYVMLGNGGSTFDMNIFRIGGVQSTWKRFAFKINPLNLVPDTLFLGFISSETSGSGAAVGSWIQIDNIRFADGSSYSSPIPNPSFENWDIIDAEDPNDWYTLNESYAALNFATAHKTADAQEGAYALNLIPDSVNMGGMSLSFAPGIAIYGFWDLVSGNISGKPFTASPTSMTGYYKWAPVSGDIGSINVVFNAAGVTVGEGNFDFTDAVGTYTPFTIPLSIASDPDTIIVFISGGDQALSSLFIDNIRFSGGNVGVKTIALTDASIGVYPNPTSDDATLKIALPKSTNVSYLVMNALGQLIVSENLGAMKDGVHAIKLSTSEYTTGVYFVKVKIGENTMTQKVIVK